MTLNIKNKRSGVLDSTPTAVQLQEGEIGVNYNSSSIALYIKDSIGDIRQIAGPGSEGSFWSLSGSTLSPLSDTYNVQIGAAATGITLNANGEATFASDVTISADLTIGADAVVLGADGNVALTGKATSDSTVAGDPGTTLTTKDYVDSLDGSTDLGIDNRTATTLDVTSSTGTNATVPQASSTQAGLMTDAQFNKLDGIAPGAQVNVQSDWTETDTTADSYIENKPVIPTDFGVTQITAGTNITISPETGVGNVTINATGGTGGASIEVSDDPPNSPSTGDLWWDSSEGGDSNGGRLYLYYSEEWVQTSNVGASNGGGGDDFWSRTVVEGQGTLIPANNLDNMEVGGDGLCVIGRRVGIARHPATEDTDPQLQVGGDAEIGGSLVVDVGNFEGALASFSVGTNADGEGAEDGGHLGIWYVTPTDNDPGGASVFTSTGPVRICTDGALQELESSITLGGGLDPTQNNWLVLDSDGNATFSGNITASGGTITGDQGSFAGAVALGTGLGPSSGAALTVANGVISLFPDGRISQSKNSASNFITCTDGSSPKFQVSGGGTVTAAGNVIAPNINTFNVQLQLEPDNFTSTTNAEGETESVYNGPTLDVKETLLQLMSAMAAINQAADSATTLANLKAAIKTATADFQEAN
jgi:hypothetical protein